MLLVALAAAQLALADSVPIQPPTLQASPLVSVHRMSALPLVALRLSVLADDPPGYAGAGHLIQHLVYPEMEERIERVGGRVQIVRNPDAVVYTVVGPAAELPYLSEVLRSALQPRPFRDAEILTLGRALAEERAAERETAEAHLRAMLRGRIFPDDAPASGTASSAARLDAETAAEAWAAMYRPDRVSIVAAGDVRLAEVESAFAELPPAPGGVLDPVGETPDPELPAPQATRGWLGVAYPAEEANPAALTIAAHLLGEALRERLPGATVRAEHWWTHQGQALAALVAVPEPAIPNARRALDGALEALRERLDPAGVEDARGAVLYGMRVQARTPEGMAELLGQFTDRSGDPDAAQRFHSSLQRVSEEEVRQLLARLAESGGVRSEIPPQELGDAAP